MRNVWFICNTCRFVLEEILCYEKDLISYALCGRLPPHTYQSVRGSSEAYCPVTKLTEQGRLTSSSCFDLRRHT